MNPAFVIIVIIICVAIWFSARRFYKPIGRKAADAGEEFKQIMDEREFWVTASVKTEEEEETWSTEEEEEEVWSTKEE